MKKKFYIFLDIDGVLYDWDYIIGEVESGRMKRGSFINKFKPESMMALNFLIQSLSIKYDVQLVISSTWRSNLPFTIKTLKDNGLKYNKIIEATPIWDPAKRGEQILSYLNDNHCKKEFVIIDDEMFDFAKYFDKKNIIKTEMFHSALSKSDVEKFLYKGNDLIK